MLTVFSVFVDDMRKEVSAVTAAREGECGRTKVIASAAAD